MFKFIFDYLDHASMGDEALEMFEMQPSSGQGPAQGPANHSCGHEWSCQENKKAPRKTSRPRQRRPRRPREEEAWAK